MATRPVWFDASQFPVESNWIDLEGNQVHFVDEGSGPVLLMLHGNPTWSFVFRRLIARLGHRFRCVAMDYPGFGLSQAQPGYGFTAAEHSRVVDELVSALDLRDVTLVIQDWGGPIGLGAAIEQPERYSGIVLGNTWAWPTEDATVRRFSALMGKGKSGALLTRTLNLFVGQMTPRLMRRHSLTSDEIAMYRGPFPTSDSRIPVQVFPAELIDAAPFLGHVESNLGTLDHLPALILWADKDIAFGKSELERWQSILSNHETHVLNGAGHFWPDDAGEEAALAIADWWDRRRV